MSEAIAGGSDDADRRNANRFDLRPTDWSNVRKAIDPRHPQWRMAADWFYTTYGPPMKSLLAHILGPKDCAEIDDLVQEICMNLADGRFEHVSRETGGRFRNYMKTVTRNAAFDVLSRRRRSKQISGEDGLLEQHAVESDGGPDRAFDRTETAQILNDALARLEASCRSVDCRWYALVVQLRFWPGKFQVTPSAGNRLRHCDLAAKMAELTGESWKVDRFKKQLERAVKACGQCIRQVVESRLGGWTSAEIDEYLAELQLSKFGA